jgi:hypothetical protein
MRRQRIFLGAAAAVVLAAGAGLVADRVAAGRAAGRVAERLQCAAGLPAAPDVAFGGGPFLTQLARGRFAELRMGARDVPLGRFTATRVEATARDVRLPGDGPLRAGSVTVVVTLGYAALPGPAAGATADGAGRLMLNTTAPLLGRQVPVTVYAAPELAGGRLTVRPVEVEVPLAGLRLPAERLPAAARQTRTVDLPDLPAGLAYRAVTASADGLRLTVDGRDVTTGAGDRDGRRDCDGTDR